MLTLGLAKLLCPILSSRLKINCMAEMGHAEWAEGKAASSWHGIESVRALNTTPHPLFLDVLTSPFTIHFLGLGDI